MRAAYPLVVAAACLAGPARAADDAPKGEDVSFKTADGLTIAATYWPPAFESKAPPPVVVALPMYKHERASYAPMVRPITDRGMALLALDLRGHGDSAKQGDEDLSKKADARDAALFNAMHADVEAAIAWLAKEKKTPVGKIGLLGASVGCSVAIDTAVRNPDAVAAVVCLTPGKNYLGVPTMEHVEKWPRGKPLLLVSSGAEAGGGADPILTKLDGKGAELKLVHALDTAGAAGAMDLHGTNMFGRVPDIEANVADWLAYRLTFRRMDLGQGVTAVVGSVGDALYVGVEIADGAKPSLESLAIEVNCCVTQRPKRETIEIGKRLERPSPDNPSRRRTRLSCEALHMTPGDPFTVRVSLDGKRFLPEAGAPPLLITLK